jgi:Autotransporter beta-domain
MVGSKSVHPFNAWGSLRSIRPYALRTAVAGASLFLSVSLGATLADAACLATAGPTGFPIWGPQALCAGTSAGASLTTAITTLNTAFLTQTSAFIGAPNNPEVNQLGGGVWIRGVGGQNTVDSVATGVANGATLAADSRSRIDFGGVQAGIDLGRFNLGASGTDLYIGLTGGVITARDSELDGPGQYNFTVPFVGLYAALTAGAFFIDAQLRGDFYTVDTTNALVGLSGQSFSGDQITFTSSAGYKFNFGSFFVEPSAGVIWSSLDMNNLGVPGVPAPGGGLPFTIPAGTYAFGTIDSLLGRVGVRVGTTVQSGNIVYQPFATASVWNEFAGDVLSTFTVVLPTCPGKVVGGGPANCGPLGIDTSRIGTYGQFGLGLAAQVLDTGWLGYVRADYRTGDNIQGWDVTGGLRYQFAIEQVSHPPLITK